MGWMIEDGRTPDNFGGFAARSILLPLLAAEPFHDFATLCEAIAKIVDLWFSYALLHGLRSQGAFFYPCCNQVDMSVHRQSRIVAAA